MKYNVRYLPIVYDDLKGVLDYISVEDQGIASSVVDGIIKRIDTLSGMAERGTPLKNKLRHGAHSNLRFLIEKKHYIFYLVEDDIVIVYRVLHTSRDYLSFLKLN